MKKLILSAIVSLLAVAPAMAQTAPQPFALPQLAYATNALEPVIDKATMELHYSKHHQAFIDKLNAEAAKTPALTSVSLEEVLKNVSDYNPTIRNNAGGHWNHTFYWSIMTPPAQSGAPSPELAEAITKTFGSMDAFKTAFEQAGTGRFGSGWVWLILNDDKELEITSTPNQDNPLMEDAEKEGQPVLGNDIWEHAYYLKYQNRRGDYLKGWWQVVNWKQVSANYTAALAAN